MTNALQRADFHNSAIAAGVITGAFTLAIRAAKQFAGATTPNPPVGCVILDNAGRVLACEAHKKAGASHAEAAAILACRKAGTHERIDTIVITLEPCNHFGRTAPCVDAIRATPARTIWIGEADPNPYVRGGGAAALKNSGLAVRWLQELDHPSATLLNHLLRRLIGPFRKWSTTNLPWITVKQALQTNGSMIPPNGQKTFTSAAGLKLAHSLRRQADAILTGSGTILADWPIFTIRSVPDWRAKQRHLAILDRRGRTPPRYLEQARAHNFDVSLHGGLHQALSYLGKCNVMEVLVEAGPTLLATLRADDLWDEEVTIQKTSNEAEDMVSIRDRVPPDTIRRANAVYGDY